MQLELHIVGLMFEESHTGFGEGYRHVIHQPRLGAEILLSPEAYVESCLSTPLPCCLKDELSDRKSFSPGVGSKRIGTEEHGVRHGGLLPT
jgi:hypothetical protein